MHRRLYNSTVVPGDRCLLRPTRYQVQNECYTCSTNSTSSTRYLEVYPSYECMQSFDVTYFYNTINGERLRSVGCTCMQKR